MVWFLNGDLKMGLKILFTVQNVRYSDGLPSHVTLPIEHLTSMALLVLLKSVSLLTTIRPDGRISDPQCSKLARYSDPHYTT